MRYFVGTAEIAGVLSGIEKGLTQLGNKVDFYQFVPHDFQYQYSPNFISKIFFMLHRLIRKPGLVIIALPAKAILQLVLLIYSIFKYDVFIFTGFNSIIRFYDLPLLKLFGKKIVVIYLGSDARALYLSGAYLDDNNSDNDPKKVAKELRKIIRNISLVESYADIIVNHTATAQLMRRSFIPLLYLGLPVDFNKINRNSVYCRNSFNKSENIIKIIHAPSRPRSKGSEKIRRAIYELNNEFCDINLFLELVEITNRSNSEVLSEISTCDFVINELYSDTFLSALDVEAAVFGKPSLKFGYYSNMIVADNHSAKFPDNLMYYEPDTLKEVIRLYALDENLRLRNGENIKRFVTEEWSAIRVAERLESLLENIGTTANADLFVDPNQLNYIFGWGLSKNLWSENLTSYINEVGKEALYLSERLRNLLIHELEQTKLND
jgi:hypothetical protein